ncbi:hypothetical protein HDK64DRAFT_313501 [Phyllosticta capitalensis]
MVFIKQLISKSLVKARESFYGQGSVEAVNATVNIPHVVPAVTDYLHEPLVCAAPASAELELVVVIATAASILNIVGCMAIINGNLIPGAVVKVREIASYTFGSLGVLVRFMKHHCNLTTGSPYWTFRNEDWVAQYPHPFNCSELPVLRTPSPDNSANKIKQEDDEQESVQSDNQLPQHVPSRASSELSDGDHDLSDGNSQSQRRNFVGIEDPERNRSSSSGVPHTHSASATPGNVSEPQHADPGLVNDEEDTDDDDDNRPTALQAAFGCAGMVRAAILRLRREMEERDKKEGEEGEDD